MTELEATNILDLFAVAKEQKKKLFKKILEKVEILTFRGLTKRL